MPDLMIPTYKLYCEAVDLLTIHPHLKQGLKDLFKQSIITAYNMGAREVAYDK